MNKYIKRFLMDYRLYTALLIIIALLSQLFRMLYSTLLFSGLAFAIITIELLIKAYKMYKLRWLRIIKNIVIAAFMLFIASFVIAEALIITEFLIPDKNIEADYAVILGAGLDGDKVSSRLEARLIKGIDYLKSNPSCKAVVTGGQGRDELIPEAEAMGKYLMDNGIEQHRILYEDKSTNTIQNIRYAKQIILDDTDHVSPVILIVTSNYHIYRGKMISKRLGFKTFGVSCSSAPLEFINGLIREYVGVVKDWLLLINS